MGLSKKAEVPVQAQQPIAQQESGTTAAIERLKASVAKAETKQYKQRDFDAEARGKSLCLLYSHAIGSCVVAGLQFDKREEAFAHMKFFVDAAMNEIFKEE